jgi:hypothetical protein
VLIGFERNKFRTSAWKCRDIVVEAFSADLPYDDFIRWKAAENPIDVHDFHATTLHHLTRLRIWIG